jgi:hypothetical protein
MSAQNAPTRPLENQCFRDQTIYTATKQLTKTSEPNMVGAVVWIFPVPLALELSITFTQTIACAQKLHFAKPSVLLFL